MDLIPIASLPAGKRATIVVDLQWAEDSFHFGTEIPHGGHAIFRHEGCLGGRISLYDVTKSGVQQHGAWLLELNPQYPPLGLRNPEMMDFL